MSFFSWLRGLFTFKTAEPVASDHFDEETEIVSRTTISPKPSSDPESPKRLEYFLSAAEHRAVEKLRLRRGTASNEAVIRLAVHRLCSLFEKGMGPQLVIPPPVAEKDEWRFSIGPKTKGRLNQLSHRIGIRHHNTVIRIAVRELFANEGVMV